jgi:VanZ family protein
MFIPFLRAAFWLCAVAVGGLSLTPVEHLPAQIFDIWDKLQHAGGFAVLALLGARGFPGRSLHLLVGLVLYGAAIELAQSATGWRFGDVWDLLADSVGVVVGLWLSHRVHRWAPAPQ